MIQHDNIVWHTKKDCDWCNYESIGSKRAFAVYGIRGMVLITQGPGWFGIAEDGYSTKVPVTTVAKYVHNGSVYMRIWNYKYHRNQFKVLARKLMDDVIGGSFIPSRVLIRKKNRSSRPA